MKIWRADGWKVVETENNKNYPPETKRRECHEQLSHQQRSAGPTHIWR
jgi:hypothetical protein